MVRPLGDRTITLGRATGVDIPLDDVYASDEHAQIVPDDGGWSVRDLGSTNGTFLNGAKLTRVTPLASGDQLRLGKTRVEVRR
jgi:pSer/pThr/pTyr-binding forkhead associated (FHA) protein